MQVQPGGWANGACVLAVSSVGTRMANEGDTHVLRPRQPPRRWGAVEEAVSSGRDARAHRGALTCG